MKRIIGTVALVGLLGLALAAPRVEAQCTSPTGVPILISWGANGFSYEGPSAYTGYISPAGNVLTNLTGPVLFCGPLAGLDPNNAGYEYTMVWSGLTSGGTTTAPYGAGGTKYTTIYTGGTFALYKGPVNARGYTNSTVPIPATALPQYSDGVVQLSGTIPSVTTVITVSGLGSVNGSFRGSYVITGGPLAALFCNSVAVSALMDGLWNPEFPATGYTGHNNGKFDAPDCTTPALKSTWGRLKVLYR